MATEVTPGDLREQVALAEKERARGPATGPFTISVHLPTFVWDGPGAWELIRDHHRYVAWKYDDMDAAHGRAGGPAPPPPLRPGEEEQLRSSIIMGTPGRGRRADRRVPPGGGRRPALHRPAVLPRAAVGGAAADAAAVRGAGHPAGPRAGRAGAGDRPCRFHRPAGPTGRTGLARPGTSSGRSRRSTSAAPTPTPSRSPRTGRSRWPRCPPRPPTRASPSSAPLTGLAAAGVAPGDVRMLFHGTTIATNALLTGGLARRRAGHHRGVPRRPRLPQRHPPRRLRPDQPRPRSWCRGGTGSRWPSGCPAAARCSPR